jgi:hypothetical protein
MTREIVIRLDEVMGEIRRENITTCQDCNGGLIICVVDPVNEPDDWDVVRQHNITCPTIPPADRARLARET